MNEFVTPSEICKLLRVSASTLDRWLKEGKFPPPIKIANTRRWPKSAVEKVLVNG